jgi:predicted enzyme related to lactoylglutathione lyase
MAPIEVPFMPMQPVVYFEIPSDNPEGIVNFYQTVFGWEFSKWKGIEGFDYWAIKTTEEGAGIGGGLMRRQQPGQPMVNTILVPDLDEWCAKVADAGGEVVVQKMEIPGVGFICYIKDVEGNIFGMWQKV